MKKNLKNRIMNVINVGIVRPMSRVAPKMIKKAQKTTRPMVKTQKKMTLKKSK